MKKNYIRPCVKNLEAYQVEPPQYDIILNANENPWDFPNDLKKELCETIMTTNLNRYPDACFTELRELLSDYTGISPDQLIAGCGSDEIINMICQAFVNTGDTIVSHAPSFSMYEIWSTIGDAPFSWVPDKEDHFPDVSAIIATAVAQNAKVIYLCNPNNPTGYLFPRHDIIQILEETGALVVLDEAYIEFKEGESHIDLVNSYPNLLVMRTLSKAFGLAGIRCGYCAGSKALIDAMYKVKSPYNLNTLTQQTAIIALRHRDKLLGRLKTLGVERRKMYKALLALPIEKVYPTAANFIYFETAKAPAIYKAMKEANILIKHFGSKNGQPEAIRLTIGSPEENRRVLEILTEVYSHVA
ncbi:MAG: histidinol-phosphate transaminase [Eubacterium aggregans]|uniref:Histidinol-phosphate aminotransferase n=1 Tax=Eubacterium aggregans TaxID=81409 RepID=A0A1H4CXF2_9FIRM|nr:histidinol-phosphate transaminase [Eubacterium aggregans]MEA5072983.1 histidinol-phosphate transaminase [Eubacterium aggregans]SEA64916.1 histidinol-phosphate aminotransferase [Eubacterium aggregans]